ICMQRGGVTTGGCKKAKGNKAKPRCSNFLPSPPPSEMLLPQQPPARRAVIVPLSPLVSYDVAHRPNDGPPLRERAERDIGVAVQYLAIGRRGDNVPAVTGNPDQVVLYGQLNTEPSGQSIANRGNSLGLRSGFPSRSRYWRASSNSGSPLAAMSHMAR